MILKRIPLFILAALLCAPHLSWAQDSTGLIPRYPNAGTPDPAVPVIDPDSVLLCIGMSQGHYECGGPPDIGTGGWVSQSTLPVNLVDGAISGWDVERIIDRPDEYWAAVESRIRTAGFTNADVQLVWGKNATRAGPNNNDTLTERILLRDSLIQIQTMVEARFPNMRAGFHSSRAYGGHCDLNPEPYSHDTIFAIEGWSGEPGAIASSSKWFIGPYFWADGINPRADGLIWVRDDFILDGCHPSQSGIDKVAAQNEIFFNQLTYSGGGNPTIPTAPTGLTANAASDVQIDLSWTDQSNDETAFRVERATGQGGAFSEIATTGANVTTFASAGLSASTEYCYRVRASNSAGNSAYTATVCASTDAATPPPPPPAQVSSGGGTAGLVDLAVLLLFVSAIAVGRRRKHEKLFVA